MKRPLTYLLMPLAACTFLGSWTAQPAARETVIFTERSGVSPYVLGVMALLALFLASVFFAYRRMRRWRVSTGTEGMIGEVGTVKVPVVQGVGGQVFVHGERWRAVPENPEEGPIRADTEVEVTGFRNGAVVVRALEHHGSTGASRP
jgi:membrane protein implicated in regulation of membrane protease activity